MISPQFVTLFVKSNKKDRNDAEAICEAISRPFTRFVPPKSLEQLVIQAIHRICQGLVSDQTRLMNQIRGLLTEHGIVISRYTSRLRYALRQIADKADNKLGVTILELVPDVREELSELDQRNAVYNNRIRYLFRSNGMYRGIGKIEGIGPITAIALVAAVADRTCFKNGRQFAAWLGLVPKQRSSSGKSRLFGISKRGDRYLRTLMIHGARAIFAKVSGKTDARSLWIGRMCDSKNARIVWSVLSGASEYQPVISK